MNAPPIATITTSAIGNTPVVRLNAIPSPDAADVYVKLESFNPTGSYKDRMALAMIEEAEQRGDLRPGMTVVEYTGGSTGSSLAFVCAVKGYRFRVVTSDAFSREKQATMRAFGADVTVIPSNGAGITRELIATMIATASDYASQPNTYFTDQLNNRDAFVGYRKIGDELLEQFPAGIDAFCAAVGVAGLSMGVAAAFADAGAATRIEILEPAESAVLSTGESGTHQVEGIGIGFRPPLLDDSLYASVRAIPQERAMTTARRLTAEEGVFSGWSTGLNVSAALDIAAELGTGHTVVTVAVDSGLKYLSGELYR
ncbi:MAG TPA: cysteine synthase family protein [Acidimicrobiia bacterium]|nr:cysteine synthase family protein [Acidimicrobiia bacterium]